MLVQVVHDFCVLWPIKFLLNELMKHFYFCAEFADDVVINFLYSLNVGFEGIG